MSSLITSKPKLESATTNLESVTAKPESATSKLESVTTNLFTTKLESVTIKDDHENENVTALSKVFKLLVVKVSKYQNDFLVSSIFQETNAKI